MVQMRHFSYFLPEGGSRPLQEKYCFIENAGLIVICVGTCSLSLKDEEGPNGSSYEICVEKFSFTLEHLRTINEKTMQKMWEMFFNNYYVNEALFNISCRKCDNNFRTFVILKKHIR